MVRALSFPDGARFAFTVMDDTDVATVKNVEPIYRLLETLGMRTTKTVWSVRCEEGSPDFSASETLDDPQYLEFAVDLQKRGFEIAFHNATMESSTRERTIRALARFTDVFGTPPRVHANHSFNRENLYWGVDRIDSPVLRALYRAVLRQPGDFYLGHRPGSPYWWGDLCAEQIEYVRNLSFADINIMRVNPSMPYRDPRRPLARWWFSASDAENADAFVELVSPANQSRLEAEGGVCIVATHFGKNFCVNGEVRADVSETLTQLARRRGWFVPVGTLLDHLRQFRRDSGLPRREWQRMQWRWARDLFLRRVPALAR
ncbi:MAG TPA: hypothetical protein VN650_13140 [Gemmatimonadaceae bacterium]|nr:hypothetical protein [Gemmatimonadaceae bacterium]